MFIVLLIIIGAILISWIKIVPQTQVYIVERLGKFHAKWEAGLHFKIPIIDNIVNKVTIKERVLDFPPQGVITKDNVSMQIDSVVYMTVTEPKLYTYGVENPIAAIENLTATTLRNIIGELELDETLTSRDVINTKMRNILDEATDPWGIKINRVEVKNIIPPRDIQDAMEKQMRAEREKRQALLEAEAHKESAITRAKGDKEAKILAAQAEKESQIALAEGRARSIELVYEAEANGLNKLAETKVTDSILKLKSIQAMKDIADGNSTKVFIPSEIMCTVGKMAVDGEALDLAHTMETKEKPVVYQEQEVDPCLNERSSYISKGVYNESQLVKSELERK